MDKISGILPSSARVTSVDMKEAGTVRPGTPGFGRAEGASALRDAKIGQTSGRAVKIASEQLDWRSKDMQNAATVRELSDKFFKGNDRPVGGSTADQIVQGVTEKEMNVAPLAAARMSERDTEFIMPNISAPAMAANEASQPEGLHPRGSFVDVKA